MGIRISKRSKKKIGLVFVCLALAYGAVEAMGQPASTSFASNVKRIQDYDKGAIKRAGDSGNPAYIRYLRSILSSPPDPQSDVDQETVIALAKLGDIQQLKRLECDLLSNDPETIDHLARDILPRIKGWFAIGEYFFMLSQDDAYEKELNKPQYNTDALFGVVYPSHWAVRYLPQIIPMSPFPRIKDLEDPRIPRLAPRWKQWIRHNRARLEQLQPIGHKGLAFSSAGCSAGEQ